MLACRVSFLGVGKHALALVLLEHIKLMVFRLGFVFGVLVGLMFMLKLCSVYLVS